MCENVARFCPTLPTPSVCRRPLFAGAEILLFLYEASSPVCRGSYGPRDLVFMRMAPFIGCYPSATPVDQARVFICEKVPPAHRDPISSPLSSRFFEAWFSNINTNNYTPLTQEEAGSSQTEGLGKVGQKRATFSHMNRPLDRIFHGSDLSGLQFFLLAHCIH